ncbi:DNA polymerase nu isoform X3 [Thunnus maccoyii]|uniref:DNA polymerase nu isoform X3 n=1 Tax=Thunnus maccoyii TaxID=8240 RepID=UPI001C4C9C52|nr:DNA polymerase nu isoform X3 [Thunnus maccoyii]
MLGSYFGSLCRKQNNVMTEKREEMEESSSRLYSGPLSKAAQKILAVLRAQTLHAARHNRSFSNNHRQMERYYGSQRESWTQTSWRISQEESTERDSNQLWSRPQMSSYSTSYHDSSNQRQGSQTSACYQGSQTSDCSLSSQASPCSSSWWDSSLQRQTSQSDTYYQPSQIYCHRKNSEPPAYQSSQTPSFSQREVSETAASSFHKDTNTLSFQIPERLSEHQATPWKNSTEEIRPCFILNLSPGDEGPDEVLFPTMEHSNTHKKEPALAYRPVSSCHKISVETDSDTSGAQREMKSTESWSVSRNEREETVASGSQSRWKQPISNPSEEATSGEDEDILYQQSESGTIKTGRVHLPPSVHVTRQGTGCDTHALKPMRQLDGEEGVEQMVDSETITGAGAGHMLDIQHEMQGGVNEVAWNEIGHKDAVLPNEKESANEMGTNDNSSLKRNLYLVSTTNKMEKSFDTEGAKQEQKEENDFEYGVNTPEIKDVERGSENKEITVGYHTDSPAKISISVEMRDHKMNPCQPDNTQILGHTVTETGEKHLTKAAILLHCEAKKEVTGDSTADNLKRATEESIDGMEIGSEVETEQQHCSDVHLRDRQRETDYRGVSELFGKCVEAGESESVMTIVDSEDESTCTEDSRRESCPALPRECGAGGSGFRAPCLRGNRQHHENVQATNGSTRGSNSSIVLAIGSFFASGQNSSVQDLDTTAIRPRERLENSRRTHQPALIPSFSLKRKHELLQPQNVNPLPKISLTRRPPKWEPPRPSQEKTVERGVSERKRIRPKASNPEHLALALEPQTKASPSHKTELLLGVHTDPYVQKQTQQRQSEVEERGHEFTRNASRQIPSSVTFKPPKHKRAKYGPHQATNEPKTSHEGANTGEPQNRPKAGCLTATLTSDPRVKDSGKLSPDEKMRMLEKAEQAKALVLTMVYRDGTTQLDPEQKLTPPVCGLLVLMKNDPDSSIPEDSLGPNDSLVYLKMEHTPAWAQKHTHQSQELFTRDMLLRVLSRSQLVVCYKAKDLLRTALQFYRQDLNWKQVAGCHIQDPQVSGWLLDPADPSSSYQELLNKHFRTPRKTPALGTKKVSQVISGLCSLYWLNMELCCKLRSQGLWELYSDMELNMIPVLAAMESHHIHVDKEALKRTSDLLGTKMKQLEQEAHRAAGQMFLVTSNTQLRTVLFEKLRLHERCENKKLPKTTNKQQQSTSEAAVRQTQLLQLQDLHPLPKIILEYRQVHKIKSTFVDGILSCMMSKSYISSTWYQTSAVTGRISAKHPNFQALPRQPLQITKKQYVRGKDEEVVTVHPRAMFIPQEGWTFLAADFCQVELRLLAHLSSDPELLRIFTNPQADVFTMLASQWKGVSEGEVTSEDREHAKRIVYSVVYGAGRERLSGILGVSAEQASQFQDSFLQTYREVQTFIQRTIQQCHKQGYVLSIMGRQRTLRNISSPDWGIRMQAERQAVNFVVQGSAADLCKTAMIRIFNLVSSSDSISARLIAQLHDELLYEVEDSQMEQFAALVKRTMESLQHLDHLGVHLKFFK